MLVKRSRRYQRTQFDAPLARGVAARDRATYNDSSVWWRRRV